MQKIAIYFLACCSAVPAFSQLMNPHTQSESVLTNRDYKFEPALQLGLSGLRAVEIPAIAGNLHIAHKAPDNMPVLFPQTDDLMPVLPPVSIPFMPMRSYPMKDPVLLLEEKW